MTGNQIRELNQLLWIYNHPTHPSTLPILPGWTKAQLNVRKQLLELGYLEVIDPAATFKQYRLTQKALNYPSNGG